MANRTDDAWEVILDRVGNHNFNRGLHSFVNPYSMLLLRNRQDIVEKIDFWYVDGISLVEKINKRFRKGINRYSFDDTSLAPLIFSLVRENSLKLAVVGTKQESLLKAVENISNKYGVNIDYFRNGYFSDSKELEECCKVIIEKGVDIVICGMGTPHQEEFLIALKNMGWDGAGYTCGGYLHQIARKETYYPRIFDQLNVRWIYRIIDEPKLFTRYSYIYPKFFINFRRFRNRK